MYFICMLQILTVIMFCFLCFDDSYVKVPGAGASKYIPKYLWDHFSLPFVLAFGTLGAVSIRKTVLPGMAIPMLKIRRPNGRLIFNMEIAIRR